MLKYHDLARSKFISLGMNDTMPAALTTNSDVDAAVKKLRACSLNAISGKDD